MALGELAAAPALGTLPIRLLGRRRISQHATASLAVGIQAYRLGAAACVLFVGLAAMSCSRHLPGAMIEPILLRASWSRSATSSSLSSRLHGHDPLLMRAVRPRGGAGFGDRRKSAAPKFKRKRISAEQLRKDHGEVWSEVEEVLRTGVAATPEFCMRARFSAMKAKDIPFLVSTESKVKGENQEQLWAKMLIQPGNASTTLPRWMALRAAESLEIVESSGLKLEYKMHCATGDVLHCRLQFIKDAKRGYVAPASNEENEQPGCFMISYYSDGTIDRMMDFSDEETDDDDPSKSMPDVGTPEWEARFGGGQ